MKIYICIGADGKIIGTREGLVLAQSVAGCVKVEEWTNTANAPIVYERRWVKL